MLVGIISDTHDNLLKLRDAIKILNTENVSLVVHSGDFIAPFSIPPLNQLNCRIIATFGNNDGDYEGLQNKFSEIDGIIKVQPVVEILDEKSICIVHGDHLDLLNTVLVSGQFDLVVSGHTHRPKTEHVGRTLHVNPGECGGWVTGRSTIAIVDLEENTAKIIDI